MKQDLFKIFQSGSFVKTIFIHRTFNGNMKLGRNLITLCLTISLLYPIELKVTLPDIHYFSKLFTI